jgi:hypothetical protein
MKTCSRFISSFLMVLFFSYGGKLAGGEKGETRDQGPASGEQVRVNPGPAGSEISEVEIRGRVVCLPEEIHARYSIEIPANHEHLYGFKSAEGKLFTLLRTRMSEALFVDKRLHEKELIMRARLFPYSQVLEGLNLKSVRDGKLFDLYYYCDICVIKTVAPEDCLCCQGPVELVEERLGQ